MKRAYHVVIYGMPRNRDIETVQYLNAWLYLRLGLPREENYISVTGGEFYPVEIYLYCSPHTLRVAIDRIKQRYTDATISFILY